MCGIRGYRSRENGFFLLRWRLVRSPAYQSSMGVTVAALCFFGSPRTHDEMKQSEMGHVAGKHTYVPHFSIEY